MSFAIRVNEIKNKYDIVDYINRFMPLHESSGKYLKGFCPFKCVNQERANKGFTVSPDTQVFYCFECHVSGDIISFVCYYNKLSPAEAIDFLEKKLEDKKVDKKVVIDPFPELEDVLESELQIVTSIINQLICDTIDVAEATKKNIDNLIDIQARVTQLYANAHRDNNPDEQ
jgi:DNA primase